MGLIYTDHLTFLVAPLATPFHTFQNQYLICFTLRFVVGASSIAAATSSVGYGYDFVFYIISWVFPGPPQKIFQLEQLCLSFLVQLQTKPALIYFFVIYIYIYFLIHDDDDEQASAKKNKNW